METPVPCHCGREPEVNKTLRGYTHSLSCTCGGSEINYLARSHSTTKLTENWNDLISGTPPRNYVQHLKKPDDEVTLPSLGSFEHGRHPFNALARYVESHGGHVGGAHGGCS